MANCNIDSAACKGCALCVAACPVKIIAIDDSHINAKGYMPAVVQDPAACIGCAACAIMCPECAITVER
jgi:2-oxoglutarate ferredoxin oxidoreductase subunit delta